MSFRNLDWRGDERCASLYLNEFTVVSTNPKLDTHVKALQGLRQFVATSQELVQENIINNLEMDTLNLWIL